MRKGAICLCAAAVMCLAGPVLANPSTGANCSACHSHMNYMDGLTTLQNYDGTANPNGQGTRKVVQVEPGQTRALRFDVGGWTPDPGNTGSPDFYSTALEGYTTRGILKNGAISFTRDPAWTSMGTWQYNGTDMYDGTTKSYYYNITIRTGTTPDYYPVYFLTAVDAHVVPGFYGQDSFYLQVTPEPMTLGLLGLGIGAVAMRRRLRRGG